MKALLSLEDLAVPDQDRFERGFAPGWRKVYRLAKGGIASEAEIADACIFALAHCLRQSGGCANLQDLVNVLQSFAQGRATPPSLSGAGGHALTEAFEALRRIERQQGGHRVTKVAMRAAMSILVRSSRRGDALYSEAGQIRALVEQICMSLVDHHLFGRARAYLVGEWFASFHEARAWEQTVKKAMSLGVQKLAARLSKDPRAAHLRAPKRTVARRSTRELLDDPLTE
jgi:hypothetical protein